MLLRKDMAPLRAAALARIEDLAAAERGILSGGKADLYLAKQAQAERVLSGDPVVAAEVPLLAAEADLDGVTLFDVAVRVALAAQAAGEALAAIERRRLAAGRAIEAATNPNELDAAEAGFAAQEGPAA